MQLPDYAIKVHQENYAKVLAGMPVRAVVELTMAMEDAAADYEEADEFDDISRQVGSTLDEGFRKTICALADAESKEREPSNGPTEPV